MNAITIHKLMERPYLKRIWVIQEIVLARSIRLLCGQRTFDWDLLENACWSSVQAWVHNKDPYGFAISESTGRTVVLQKLVYPQRWL
jgi:hypothetical protein